MTKQIKVGSVVKVINRGQRYTTYEGWATTNSFNGYEPHKPLNNGDEGTVEVIAPHHVSNETLCGIIVNGVGHIIGIEGLEFVRENKPFDLQLFQRVELRNGEKGIVVTNTQEYHDSTISITLEDGWVDDLFSGESTVDNGYEIVKIFDLPHFNSDMLDINVRGKLLWEETIPVKPEVVAADLAITEAENAVKAAQVALEAAKAARQAL